MNYLQRLEKARRKHAEAKIALKHAKEALEEQELKFIPTGKNADDRKRNFKLTCRGDQGWQFAKRALDEAEIDAIKAEMELEVVLDERRQMENETWAKAVEAVRGKADHIGHAPIQLVKQQIKEEIMAELGGQHAT